VVTSEILPYLDTCINKCFFEQMSIYQPELLLPPSDETAQEIDYATSDSETRGAVFTRNEVVCFILDLIGWTETSNLNKASLLEPSFGAGEFITEALRRYLKSVDSPTNEQLEQAFLGVEIHAASHPEVTSTLTSILVSHGFQNDTANSIVEKWLVIGDFLTIPIDQKFTHIVGNPPYIRQESIPDSLLRIYRARYATMYDRADIYVPFFERSLELLSPSGELGFICSDRWMKNKYGGPLRELVSLSSHLKTYVDFTGCPAFDQEVVAYPAVTVITNQRGSITNAAYRPKVDGKTLSSLTPALRGDTDHPDVFRAEDVVTSSQPWILERFDRLAVIRQLEREFPTLEESGCKVGIGVATGADKVYIGTTEKLDVEPERLLPLVTTKDFKDQNIDWKGLHVLNPFDGDSSNLVDPANFPKFASYLEKHRPLIEKRHVAKKNPGAWFKTIDRIHPTLTSTPKLLIPDINGKADIVYDKGEFYPHHNLYFITSSDWDLQVLQKILLSRLAEAFVATYSVKMRGDCLRYQAQYLRRIRVPRWQDVSTSLQNKLRKATQKEITPLIQKLYRLDDQSWEALAP